MRVKAAPKILYFGREKVSYDLSGMDRKDISDILNVCGKKDETSDEWMDYMTKKITVVDDVSAEKYLEAGGGFEMAKFKTGYIEPYLKRLKEWTGYSFSENDEIPIISLCGAYHTHTVLSAKIIRGKDLVVDAFIHVYPHIGEKLDDLMRKEYAHKNCLRYVNSDLGKTEVPREFIESSNGQYKPNPDYASGKPMKITACCDNENLWQELFGIWHKKEASSNQDAILSRMSHVRGCPERYPSLHDYQGIHLDDYRTYVTIEDFRLGKLPPVPATVPAK